MGIPTLRSPTIPQGGLIPDTHTANGQGVSPALNWRRPPPGKPYLTIVAHSWLPSGGDEIVHWLVFDLLEFIGGLKEDAGQGPGWTVGFNADGNADFLAFSGKDPRRVRFDMYASRSPTGFDGPASWSDISEYLRKTGALGPFGFEAYDVSLPKLLGVSS